MSRLLNLSKDCFVLSLEETDLIEENLLSIFNSLKNDFTSKKILLDLSKTKVLHNYFFNHLKDLSDSLDVSVCNVNVENLTLFYLMNYNHIVDLFMCREDFMDNKKQLVKRDFVLCL